MARAGPGPTRTAGSVIALANQQSTSAWVDHVRESTPEVKPELPAEEDVSVPHPVQLAQPLRPARPVQPAQHLQPLLPDIPMEEEEEDAVEPASPAAVATPKITLRIRSQAATPVATRPPEPPTRSGRPKRVAANGKAAAAKKGPAKKATPKGASRGRKRKASEDEEESEAADSGGDDDAPAPRRNGQRSSPPPAPTGRVLRSRAARPSLREPSLELSEEE